MCSVSMPRIGRGRGGVSFCRQRTDSTPDCCSVFSLCVSRSASHAHRTAAIGLNQLVSAPRDFAPIVKFSRPKSYIADADRVRMLKVFGPLARCGFSGCGPPAIVLME